MEGVKHELNEEGNKTNDNDRQSSDVNKRFKPDESGDGIDVSASNLSRSNQQIDTQQHAKIEADDEPNKDESADTSSPEKPDPNKFSKDTVRRAAQKISRYFKRERKRKEIEFDNRIEDMDELEDLSMFQLYKSLKSKSELLDSFIKNKLLQIKESLLQPPVKLKQNLRIKTSSSYNPDTSEWTLRIEGRVMTKDKADVLEESNNMKMLQFFDKIFIEFEKDDKVSYMNIDWRKLNNTENLNYDAIEVTRKMLPDVDSFNTVIKLFKDYSPKEYILSEKLADVLKVKQGTMMKITNALWMYIKLNRLQHRNTIKMHSGLKEVFNKDSVEFHKINSLLRQQLKPVPHIEIKHTISKTESSSELIDVPVEVHSKYRKEFEDFIVENNINFISDQDLDTQISESLPFENQELTKIEKGIMHNMNRCLKKSAYAYRFYSEFAENPLLKIQNTIIEQNRYLKVMSEQKVDPTFDLENEEQYAQFYKENQSWLYPEVEDYASEVALNQEIEKNLILNQPEPDIKDLNSS